MKDLRDISLYLLDMDGTIIWATVYLRAPSPFFPF